MAWVQVVLVVARTTMDSLQSMVVGLEAAATMELRVPMALAVTAFVAAEVAAVVGLQAHRVQAMVARMAALVVVAVFAQMVQLRAQVALVGLVRARLQT